MTHLPLHARERPERPLAADARRAVAWLSIDSEKPSNAGFNEKFPMEGIPAFLVIDPNSGKATLSWYGTATASQLNGLMEEGLRAVAGGGGGSGADALWREPTRRMRAKIT